MRPQDPAQEPAPRTEHRLPFGKYRGQPPADVPTSYLAWLLESCKLGSGLAAAVRAELLARGVAPTRLPAEPQAPLPRCRRCGGHALLIYWQERGGAGGRTIRGDCARCRHFVAFLPQTVENTAAADRAGSPTGEKGGE